MTSKSVSILFIILAMVLLCSSIHLEAQLQVGFYGKTCPLAELIVKDEVKNAFLNDSGIVADFVRMHFHDCFVRGCDGSVLIDSTPSNRAEKDSIVNNPSLEGFDIIDKAKARLENLCKGVVSCADIIAFAARDSVKLSVGLGYDVPAGRRDGRVSLASETLTELPPPTFNLDQLTESFKKKGLTREVMVTLSGAHTIGKAHCTSFSNRLYNFSSTTSQDPSLDPNYATQLKQQCPKDSNDPNLEVLMDPTTPTIMDKNYYVDILANRGLFTSDQTLISNPNTAQQVRQFAHVPFLWNVEFAEAMVKMGQVDVLTGTAGEIRLNCRVPN